LAVAKEFIDRLGGTIRCDSVLGEGSCFSIRLPRYEDQLHGPAPAMPGPNSPAAVGGRTRRFS
jgi:hypothetical protein